MRYKRRIPEKNVLLLLPPTTKWVRTHLRLFETIPDISTSEKTSTAVALEAEVHDYKVRIFEKHYLQQCPYVINFAEWRGPNARPPYS